MKIWLKIINSAFLLTTVVFLMPLPCSSEIYDRVVAFVDDHAITLSEFQEQHAKTLKVSPDVNGEDVLNAMINRKILLQDAKEYRIDAPTEDEIMRDYIDLKVRAFIRISESQTEAFYKDNIGEFRGKSYEEARDEIDNYLAEKEVNKRLKDLITELRGKTYIKIQLRAE